MTIQSSIHSVRFMEDLLCSQVTVSRPSREEVYKWASDKLDKGYLHLCLQGLILCLAPLPFHVLH